MASDCESGASVSGYVKLGDTAYLELGATCTAVVEEEPCVGHSTEPGSGAADDYCTLCGTVDIEQ